MFYDEHTLGADESITNPLSENTVIQWGQKSAYVWTAVKQSGLLREKALGYLQPLLKKSDVPTIAVFNTLNWQRSGLINVYIDHDVLPWIKNLKSSMTKAETWRLTSSKVETTAAIGRYGCRSYHQWDLLLLRIEVDRTATKSMNKAVKVNTLETNFIKLN